MVDALSHYPTYSQVNFLIEEINLIKKISHRLLSEIDQPSDDEISDEYHTLTPSIIIEIEFLSSLLSSVFSTLLHSISTVNSANNLKRPFPSCHINANDSWMSETWRSLSESINSHSPQMTNEIINALKSLYDLCKTNNWIKIFDDLDVLDDSSIECRITITSTCMVYNTSFF